MNRNAIFSLILSAMVCALSIGAYLFWYGTVSALSARTAALSASIVEKTEDAKRIAEAKTTLGTLAKEEALVEQYFISTANIVSFLEELQATGKSLGARVEVTSVSSDESSSHPHLTVSLMVSGTWSSVMRTLGALEFSSHDITTNDVVLGISGKNNWVATGTFLVGTRKPVPSAPSPLPAAQTP